MTKSQDRGSEAGEALPRLPPGRHGLPREFVVKNQRDRLAAGMIEVVAERGYHETTVSLVAAAAGVSRRTFYGYFAGKSEGFFDTFEIVTDFILGAMREAGAEAKGWPARVRVELRAALELLAANPDLVRFSMVAPPAAGGEVAERYRGFLEQLLEVLTEGRPRNLRRPSVAAEHAVVGGLAALIADKVEAGGGEQLADLLPDLTELVLAPYLGRDRALAEARKRG